MATASKGDEDKSYEYRNSGDLPTADDMADDFELISDASLVDSAKVISVVSEYGSRGEEEGEKTVENQETLPVIDPLAAFEMIQSEHRLLKDELDEQNKVLHQRLESMKEQEYRQAEEVVALKATLTDQERRHAEEVTALKSELTAVSIELNEKKAQMAEMELQLKYFKESSEQADLLTAKLMEAEDLVKSQHATIQQLQADGYGGYPATPAPQLSTDQTLRDEIAKRDDRIKRLEETLVRLESAVSATHGERLKAQEEARRLAGMNHDLQNLAEELQSQAEMDKTKADLEKHEWDALRANLQQQIQVLSDRVIAFENQYSGVSFNQAELDANGTAAEDIATLRHRGMPAPSSSTYAQPPGSVRYVECQRCHLPMATVGPHPCPSIIDGLD